MSKCREEFKAAGCDEHQWEVFVLAWNAAMTRAAEICRDQQLVGSGAYTLGSKHTATECADAIEQENFTPASLTFSR